MHDFCADASAVDFFTLREQFVHRCPFVSERIVEKDGSLAVFGGKAVGLRIEVAERGFCRKFQRIDLGCVMTEPAVGAHQRDGADRVDRRLADVRAVGEIGAFATCEGCCVAVGVEIVEATVLCFPRGAALFAFERGETVAEIQEEFSPAFVDRFGMMEVLSIECCDPFDIGI